MKVTDSIQVHYESTSDANTAKKWFDSLPSLISVDLETAIRYSDQEIQEAKEKMLDMRLSKYERIKYQAIAKATALGHPYHCTITHANIAWSEKDAYVFIIDDQAIADVILDGLVTTTRTQIWHNYCYDGRFMRYYVGADPINIEDTQILAKSIINHVEVFKARTGLKELAGAWYGAWGISSDNFTLAEQYNEQLIKYSATDACATFKLWEYLQNFIAETQDEKGELCKN